MILGNAWVEKLHGGMLWAEGPVWFADGQYLLWSDIPKNVILQYCEGAGVRVFRHPSNNTTAIPAIAKAASSAASIGAPRQPHRTRRLRHRAGRTATRASG